MVEMKFGQVGRKKSLARAGYGYQSLRRDIRDEPLTVCATKVSANVMRGEMSGSTAKEVSPTRPRVTLLTAVALSGSFR